MKKYEFLEHPADIQIRSFGENLEELFSNSALAMMNFIYGENAKRAKDGNPEKVELKSDKLDSLLIDWLSELLYLTRTNYQPYFDYKFKKLDENNLSAEVFPGKGRAKNEIKAVTYHNLSVKKNNQGYEALVVYDI